MMLICQSKNVVTNAVCLDAEKPCSVVQGAVETLTSTISDLSLKDSVKSDSTGGGRLVTDSMQSNSITPASSVDRSKSEVFTGKSSVMNQQSFDDKSDDKMKMVCTKSALVADSTPPSFDVVSLLKAGQTLRYLDIYLT